jgi:TolA-binding protein
MTKWALYNFLCICLIGVWGCATQSDVNTIDNRITEMEMRDAELNRGREALKSDIENRNQELRKQSASLRAELERMNEEIRILGGRLDELEHSLSQQQRALEESENKRQEKLDRLAQLTDQNSDKILRLQQYLDLESSKKPMAAVTPGVSGEKPVLEDELYQSAKQAFDQGDFEAARRGFQELIKRYPILEYQNVIEKYPNGNKVPAALLKQGLAFANIGDKPNAKLILEELRRKYPDSNEAKVAAEQLKTLK